MLRFQQQYFDLCNAMCKQNHGTVLSSFLNVKRNTEAKSERVLTEALGVVLLDGEAGRARCALRRCALRLVGTLHTLCHFRQRRTHCKTKHPSHT